MSELRGEIHAPDPDEVPESIPVQDNDETLTHENDGEDVSHPDALAGEQADGDLDFDPTGWPDEPNGDEPTGGDER